MKKIIIGILVFLSACSWTPVYKTVGLIEQTNTVLVNPIPNLSGRLMTRLLNNILNPDHIQTEKKYVLSVNLTEETVRDQGILSDDTASRENLYVTADYELKDIKSGKVILNSSTKLVDSYDILSQPYATVTRSQKARENLIQLLSETIGNHVASVIKNENLSQSN